MEEICANCNNWELGRKRNAGELYCQKCKEWVIATDSACNKFENLPFFGAYDKKARSTEAINEAKPPCFITTAVVNILGMADDCNLLKTLRLLRVNYMQGNPEYRELLMKYDTLGPAIATALLHDENRVSVAQDILGYLIKAQQFVNRDEIETAISLYSEMTEALIRKYVMSYCIPEKAASLYDQENGGHGAFKLKRS